MGAFPSLLTHSVSFILLLGCSCERWGWATFSTENTKRNKKEAAHVERDALIPK